MVKITRRTDGNPKYITVHKRMEKAKGKANVHKCVRCKWRQAHGWSLMESPVGEILISDTPGRQTPYTTNLDDYVPKCRKCGGQQRYVEAWRAITS